MFRSWLYRLAAWMALVALGLAGNGVQAAPAAPLTVNSTLDAPDANIGNGVCLSSLGFGTCTLRAAIQEASANPDSDIISVPAGTYVLTIGGASENGGFTGDLDITGTVTINGAGPASTVINGNGAVTNDRVMQIMSGQVTIDGVTIQNGLVANHGGGILNSDGALTLANSVVVGNVAAGAGWSGGGIYSSGPVTVTGSAVLTNSAEYGGGIYISGGFQEWEALIITATTIRGNNADFGGGIYAGHSAVTVTTSTFSNNQAGLGGGMNASNGKLSMANSTLSGNRSAQAGGGLWIGNLEANVFNVTITNNTADTDATGDGSGGGVAVISGMFTLRNTIIAGNFQNDPFGGGGVIEVDDDCSGTLQAPGSNILYAAPPGTCTVIGPVIQAFPMLGPLADNGGPTATHALLPGSPGIDEGQALGCTDWNDLLILTDQRSVPRPQFGEQSLRCDLGAYEFVGSSRVDLQACKLEYSIVSPK